MEERARSFGQFLKSLSHGKENKADCEVEEEEHPHNGSLVFVHKNIRTVKSGGYILRALSSQEQGDKDRDKALPSVEHESED